MQFPDSTFSSYLDNVNVKNYCKYKCPRELAEHMICKYSCQVGPECGVTQEIIEFNNTMRQYIVDVHNYMRNYLASGNDHRGGNAAAADMTVFSYNKECETTAMCFALRCDTSLEECVSTSVFLDVGRNFYHKCQPNELHVKYEDLIKDSILSWYEEIAYITVEDILNFQQRRDAQSISKFTQLVWANTRGVGCAGVQYSKNVAGGKEHCVLLVCHYVPTGNVDGKAVYTFGVPASECPADRPQNEQYQSLCGSSLTLTPHRIEFNYKVGDFSNSDDYDVDDNDWNNYDGYSNETIPEVTKAVSVQASTFLFTVMVFVWIFGIWDNGEFV